MALSCSNARSPRARWIALGVLAAGCGAAAAACSSSSGLPPVLNGTGPTDAGSRDGTTQTDSGNPPGEASAGDAPADGSSAGDAPASETGADANADVEAGCGNPTTMIWAGQAGDLVVGNGHVYFVGGGSLYSAPIVGDGAAPQVLSSGTNPQRLALDKSNVYFTSGNAVMSVPADGSAAPTPLAQGTAAADAIAVDGTNVYWIQGGSTPQILGAPKSGGTPTVLVANAGSGAATPNGGNLAAVSAGTNTNLIWLDAESGPNGQVLLLGRASTLPDAGSPVQLFGGGNGGYDLQVVGTSVYWTDVDGGWSGSTFVPLGDAGGVPNAVPGLANQFFADSNDVYVLTPRGQVLRSPVGVWTYQQIYCSDGGTVTVGHITADAANIYFTTDQGVFVASQ